MSFVVGPYQDTFGLDSHCSAQWVVGTLGAYSAVGKAESGVYFTEVETDVSFWEGRCAPLFSVYYRH